MGHLHGPVVGGVVQIDQRVKFMKEVQSGLFYPWQDVWYADGDNGDDGYSGRGPADSKASISAAITAAAAQDIIYVRPRLPVATDMTDPTPYAENLVIPVAKYGLSIIGAGNNPRNPFYSQVKPDTAGFGVKIQAVSTLIENLDFNKGTSSTGLIYFSGDVNTTDMGWGSLIANCHLRNASSAANASVMMYGGSYNTIYNCDFEACHTGVVIQSGGTYPIRSLRIEDCRFKGANEAAVAGENIKDIGAACIVYELEILRCYFERLPTGKFINLTANTYGLIADCQFGDADVTCWTSGKDINIPTTVFISGCYDESGTMIVKSA